jgi:hypothetical protein
MKYVHHNFPFRDLPKYNKIDIFPMKIYYYDSANIEN